MIAKLRRRFIISTMLAVVLVLALLMAAVNIVNYINTDREAEELLSYLCENEGIFPEEWFAPRGGARGRGNFFASRGPSPETPYATRYFTVRLNAYGYLLSVDTENIAAVSGEQAFSMAWQLWQQGQDDGYLGPYKYMRTGTDSVTMYVFLDCGEDLAAVNRFCLISILVTLLGAVAIFLLLLPLSKKAVTPMAESYEKQKQFITNAGHEIKTPLAVIDSCTEVLELEQGENKWTQGIREQIGRLDDLTRQLVSLARLDETESVIHKQEFDLSAAVAESLQPFALLAGKKELVWQTELEPELRYAGSEPALRRLCGILADNALKYSAPGGPVVFSLARRGRHILLSCRNPAEGLSPGEQPHFFDRFWRGDASRSTEITGHGIGLSLAKAIVEAHGGSIRAHSPDGRELEICASL